MQRYFAKEYNDGLILRSSDIHHIKNVMRMKVKDTIEVVYDDKLFRCVIDSMSPFAISIKEEIHEENKLCYDITIAIALVKEQKMDLILQKLTELGVSRIIPVNMQRSIVKIDNEKFKKKKERWEAICKEASEQSKRTNIPIIEDIMSVKDLASLEADYRFVASTNENKLLNNYLQKLKDCAKIIMVIGPEGGISEDEESLLVSEGFIPVSFGSLIFRTETAAIYASAIFNFWSSMR